MNSGRRARMGFRLTHLPSGEHVDVYADNHRGVRSPYHPRLMEVARSWLAARVRFSREPKREGEVRVYRLGSSETPTLTHAMLMGHHCSE